MITKKQISSYDNLLELTNIDLTSFSSKDSDIDTYKEFVKNEAGQYSRYNNKTDFDNSMKQQKKELKQKLRQLKKIKSNRLRYYLKNHIEDIKNTMG